MAKTQNGYSTLSKYSLLLRTITVNGHSTKVRAGNVAWMLNWVAKQLHYGVEHCVSLYGWRDPALNAAVGGLKSSNHISGTAIDYNGGRHPYEYTWNKTHRPGTWTSGWTAKQNKQIADILRTARVVEWGNNLSLFPRGFRDPMHFAISRYSSSAGLSAAVKRLKGGRVKVTKNNTHGRVSPRSDSKIIKTRDAGYVFNYVQVAYRDDQMWLRTKYDTWYPASNTTF